MARFSWAMSPEDFVQQLRDWSIGMRRIAGGTIGGRRHVKDVRRRRRKWYRSVNPDAELPQVQRALRDDEWKNEHPSALQIVIQPETFSMMSEEGGASSSAHLRKSMRRLMHLASARTHARQYALVNAREGRGRLPPIGRRPDGPRPETRALYLEAMGIAIVPELSPDEQSAFEEAGAIIIPNDLVTIDDPTDRGAVSAQETGKALSTSPDAHLVAIDVPAARKAGLTGKGVRIGVLDTGIDAAHPEFADSNIEFMAFRPDGQRRAVKAKDYGNHGTHVAALCGGRTVGVAPGADLVVAAVLTEKNGTTMSGYTAQILAGMDWLAGGGALTKAVDLVNASLGSPTAAKAYRASVEAYRVRGILTIAAIGNDGRGGIGRHSAPAMLDCAMGVGAVDDKGLVADFSDWGPCDGSAAATFKPDVMAPGVAVRSAVPGKRYERMSGTSMACPIVTGAAALLIERDAALRGDPDELSKRLLSLAQPLSGQSAGYDPRRGGRGRLLLTSIAN